MWQEFGYAFIPIFVAMDVGGIIPVFLSLTQSLSDDQRKRVGTQAILTAFAVSLIFMAVGRWVLRVLGITVSDFQIAGGVVLLVLAVVEMLRLGREILPSAHVGAVPLGTPMIVGPAVLTSLIILIPLHGYAITIAALFANLVIVGLSFRQGGRLVALVGEDGLKATSQVIGLFLAAIAVSMIRRGIQSIH